MSDLLDELRGHSLAEIRASLAETIEWCSNPVHDREANRPLRSVALEPQALYGSRKRVVGHVISCRKDQLIHQRHEAQALQLSLQHKNITIPSQTYSHQGRLLVYEPDNDLTDGAAQVESYGYFDLYNAPPWDTWVANVVEPDGKNWILCWVPGVYLKLAEIGIKVNPEECIYWLNRHKPALAQLLG